MRPDLFEWGLRLAEVVAQRGTCARRQVGCVLLDEKGIVLATGYNGVRPGAPHCNEGFPCPGALVPSGTGLDLCRSAHAEQNAVAQCQDISRIYAICVTASPCVSCIKMLMNTRCTVIAFRQIYPHSEAQSWAEEAGIHWLHRP